jgi:hypothetical protein
MQGSRLLRCGKCGDDYRQSRGGWSHGRTVHPHYPGLRLGAQEGDPLHDACYQTIYRAMVCFFVFVLALIWLRVGQQSKKRKRDMDDKHAHNEENPASAAAGAAAPNGGALTAAEQAQCAALLSRQFKAKPIVTLHATAPHRNLTVAHLPNAMVGSADAAASTVRARSALIEHVMHAVAAPNPGLHGCDYAADGEAAKKHSDAQRESLVKRQLPAYTAAVATATGTSHGPFTVDELLELKKFTG